MKKTIKRVLALTLAVLAALPLCACKKQKEPVSGDVTFTDVPVVTADPEGSVTAGPTATPETFTDEPVYTDVPIVTADPEGSVTAGPTATPEPVYTNVPIVTAGPTATPDSGTAEPAYTNVPVITAAPGVTAGPTATPKVTSAPSYTNVPIVTAGPTATPVPSYTNVPVITAAPGVTAGPTPTPVTPTAAPTAAPTGAPITRPTDTPAPTGTELPYPTPDKPNSYTAVYAGEEKDVSTLKVGDTFYWCIDLVNEHSCLHSGIWMIDYPEEYLEPIDFSVKWSGSLTVQIDNTWDDEEPWSDRAMFFTNMLYEGGTGANPYGTAGNMYSLLGMALNSPDCEFGGVQMAGHMGRIQFKIKALPEDGALQRDAGGLYLPIPITVVESNAVVNADEFVTHGSITVTPGKLYFKH